MSEARGVVLTGVYGVGKSSTIEEMAELLEQRGLPYGAIDVDWLWWFDAPGVDDQSARDVLFANLSSVVKNYRDAGVMHFLLAWSIRDREDLGALRAAMPFPLRIIRLTASAELIRQRLAPSVNAGRQRELRAAERWLRDGIGSDLGDAEVSNDRPIREVACSVLDLLEWS